MPLNYLNLNNFGLILASLKIFSSFNIKYIHNLRKLSESSSIFLPVQIISGNIVPAFHPFLHLWCPLEAPLFCIQEYEIIIKKNKMLAHKKGQNIKN
jgi:hypothetical protein